VGGASLTPSELRLQACARYPLPQPDPLINYNHSHRFSENIAFSLGGLLLLADEIIVYNFSTIRVHLISGLPRSRSTFLAAILRQNPRIHVAIASPVGSLFSALHYTTGQRREYSDFISKIY
jgi:hypothetical protein